MKEQTKLVDGYKHNPLPNRKTRRAQAKAKNKQAWAEANKQWSNLNKQTRINNGQSGETDGGQKTN